MSTEEMHTWYLGWLDDMSIKHKDNPGILKKLNQLRTLEEERYEKSTD